MGEWESERFRLECSSVAGFERCRHLGYLPLSHVYGRLMQADVGLAVLHPEKSYLRAIPTKAFDYMAASLPIIMSDFPLWRRLFHDCALFVNPLDTDDIAEKMTTLGTGSGTPTQTRHGRPAACRESVFVGGGRAETDPPLRKLVGQGSLVLMTRRGAVPPLA